MGQLPQGLDRAPAHFPSIQRDKDSQKCSTLGQVSQPEYQQAPLLLYPPVPDPWQTISTLTFHSSPAPLSIVDISKPDI